MKVIFFICCSISLFACSPGTAKDPYLPVTNLSIQSLDKINRIIFENPKVVESGFDSALSPEVLAQYEEALMSFKTNSAKLNVPDYAPIITDLSARDSIVEYQIFTSVTPDKLLYHYLTYSQDSAKARPKTNENLVESKKLSANWLYTIYEGDRSE